MAEVTIKLDSPISIVDKGTPSTTNLPKGSIALEKDKNNNLKIYGNVGNEVVDIERVDALDNGDASASFVAGRNLKVNGWEFYWKDVWEESEPSAIKHIESAGVNAAINEIKGTGADVSAFTFPTTKDEFIAYLKTITFDFSNQPNQVSGYGSTTYGIMNKNAGTTTIVEGMRNNVPNKIHRSHIEGQYMTFPDVEYALDCHVEGQDCDIVGYASLCHLEGNSSAVVHSMGKNVGFFDEACACHVEGGGGVVGGAYSHVEGDGCAALNNGAHCEGKGYYKKRFKIKTLVNALIKKGLLQTSKSNRYSRRIIEPLKETLNFLEDIGLIEYNTNAFMIYEGDEEKGIKGLLGSSEDIIKKAFEDAKIDIAFKVYDKETYDDILKKNLGYKERALKFIEKKERAKDRRKAEAQAQLELDLEIEKGD